VLNDLRSRVRVQTDGKLQTGRDVTIAALLGAEEFGFSTTPLVSMGCIMMRKCHLNTCSVGIATQDPVLRARFTGQPEHVINFFFFVAEEVRELMAEMGYRTFDEMIGQMQMLDAHTLVDHWKARGLDFSKLFMKPDVPASVALFNCERQDHKIHDIIDRKLIAQSQAALESGTPVRMEFTIRNVDRTVGAMLSGEIAKRYDHEGLPADTIVAKFKGTAGQSFGAFLARGVTFELEGDANDYVGKGLSGGRIVVRPPAHSAIVPEESIIIGNTVLYGAVEGECFFRGVAGERFAVRNSGAVAVIEGAGDHCCEYMTGGVVVVLGPTGRNFAAGMSGGIAYVLDDDDTFASRCNMAMVALEPMPGEEDINSKIFHHARDLEAHGMVDIMSDMSRFDGHRLHHLIARHARFTGSVIAAEILSDWKTWYPKFRKVMPVEYRRALNEMKAAAIAAE
jgi:glutamate synthase (NADPH/NADH) large chain